MAYTKGNKLNGGAPKMHGAMKVPTGKSSTPVKKLSISMMDQGKTHRGNKLSK